MALRSNTGISRGMSEEDEVEEAGLDWAEQSVAIISRARTQRIGVRIDASSCEMCVARLADRVLVPDGVRLTDTEGNTMPIEKAAGRQVFNLSH